jgi:hypothetical protein
VLQQVSQRDLAHHTGRAMAPSGDTPPVGRG